MVDVLNYGVPYMLFVAFPDFYPFGEVQLCNYYPPDFEDDSRNAITNKPDEIFRIKDTDNIKLAISKGLPVVIGMNVPPSFEVAIGKKIWRPLPSETRMSGYGHAVVVVGYDNNKHGGAFEVLNSWGEAWGDSGYIWIKYSDFKKFFLGGYALYKEKKLGKESHQWNNQDNTILMEGDKKLSSGIKNNSNKSNRWKQVFKK
jgi:hypothetical protein